MANAGSFKKGEKRPNQGRPKGCKNKATVAIKEAFREAFDEMGGVDALVNWGRDNPTQFYQLASKLIPTEVEQKTEHSGEVAYKWLTE